MSVEFGLVRATANETHDYLIGTTPESREELNLCV